MQPRIRFQLLDRDHRRWLITGPLLVLVVALSGCIVERCEYQPDAASPANAAATDDMTATDNDAGGGETD